MRAAVEDEAVGPEHDTSASVISTSLGVAQRVQAGFYVIGIVHFESIYSLSSRCVSVDCRQHPTIVFDNVQRVFMDVP